MVISNGFTYIAVLMLIAGGLLALVFLLMILEAAGLFRLPL